MSDSNIPSGKILGVPFEPPNPDELANPTDLKDGWKTSEFWAMLAAKLAAIVLAIYTLTGKASEGALVADMIAKAVVSVGALVVIAIAAWQYIKSRKEVKVAALQSSALVESAAMSPGLPR